MMKVFVPYHISGVWKPILSRNPLESGSVGIGIVLSSGVELLYGELRARRPVSKLDPTSMKVLELTGTPTHFLDHVEMRERYGLGQGYGASAARALALSIAIEVVRGSASFTKACEVAHVAEVLCGTGLGDVVAEAMGFGIVVRLRHGPPGRGVIECFVPRKRFGVVTASMGTMSTREMHELFGSRINRFAAKYMEQFLDSPSMDSFVEASHGFSLEVGFLPRDLDEALRNKLRPLTARGEVLGYFVKKKLLVVVCVHGAEEEVSDALRSLNLEPRIDCVGMRRAVVEV